MKAILKKTLFNLAPKTMAVIQSIRARRHSHSLIKKWGISELNNKLRDNLGDKVIGGPFEGLILPESAFSEHVGPFLLGSYESELNPIWEKIFNKDYVQIFDIGCKFGYYAVGLAKKFPKAKVYCFDIDPWARSATKRCAWLNGLNNLEVKGFFEKSYFRKCQNIKSLIVCDIDGAELELFGPDLIPFLGETDALIELHDCFFHGCEKAVRSAFPSNCSSSLIEMRTSDIDSPQYSFLNKKERLLALNEIRPKQNWIFVNSI